MQVFARVSLGIAPVLACVGLLSTPALALAATKHVDDSAPAGGDGSAGAPYQSIQAAVNAAASGDTVKVAAGSYGPVTIDDKEVLLYGGYADGGDFTTRSPGQNVTRITGTTAAPTVTCFNCRHSVIDGFVISGGRTGVLIDSDDFAGNNPDIGAPVVQGNLIEGNGVTNDNGGGIVALHCHAKIIGNVVRDNIALRGAAMATEYCTTLLIEGNQFLDNGAHEDHGGGLYLTGPNLVVRKNLIKGNRVGLTIGYGWGGGAIVYGVGAKALFQGNVWTDNYAPTIGSGLFIDDGAEAVVQNDLFYKQQCTERGGHAVEVDGYDTNVSSKVTLENVTITQHHCPNQTEGGAAVFVERQSTAIVKSSIIWDNGGDDFLTDGTSSIQVSYSDIQEQIGGTGNISVDPMFEDPAAADFHVKSTKGRYDPVTGNFVVDAVDSPTIDSGDPAGSYSLEPGPNGMRVNMGHTGNTPEASMGAPGGTPPVDAGPPPDGSPFDDAGVIPGGDGGPGGGGGGGDDDEGSGGCGCRTGRIGGPGAQGAMALLLVLGAVLTRRR
jgi:MYXO-CTERM domain-containing protein